MIASDLPRSRSSNSPRKDRDSAPAAVLFSSKLAAVPFLQHGFSTRRDPERLSKTDFTIGSAAADEANNLQRFAKAIGAEAWRVARVRQVHSDIVHTLRGKADSSEPPAGDGLITNAPGVLVAVLTADCVPVLVADAPHRAVGAFHAGWRGTLARIVEKGIGTMQRDFGTDPRDIVAAIGPAIGVCCYEVGEEVTEKFETQFAYAGELFQEVANLDPVRRKYPLMFMNMRAPGHGEPPSRPHLNLIEANRRQLLDAGVHQENIDVLGLCTSCHSDLLHSYRKQGDKAGRMVAGIGFARP